MFEHAQSVKSENWLTALSRDLKIASLAAVSVWILLYFILPDIGDDERYYQFGETRSAILNAFSFGYIASAFVLILVRDFFIVQRFPAWLNISVLGSVLSIPFAFVTADAMFFSSSETRGILFQWNWSGVFIVFVLGTIILSLYTLPFTLLIYYSSYLWQRLKKVL